MEIRTLKNSCVISSVAWDETTRTLYVVFVDEHVIKCLDVTKDIYLSVCSAIHPFSYVYSNVLNKHEFSDVEVEKLHGLKIIKKKESVCEECSGTGFRGVFHPRTLELAVVKCKCKQGEQK